MTFTAQELESALELQFQQYTDGETDTGSEGWGELNYCYGPNPSYDGAKYLEYNRLIKVARDTAGYNQDSPEWQAVTAYRDEHEDAMNEHIRVPAKVEVNGTVYDVTTVEDYGGMDMGSTRYIVFEVDGRLFRKDGYYASHYGTDWDGDFREVRKVVKEVNFYE